MLITSSSSRPEKEPEMSDTDGADMETETDEEQTAHTAERNHLDENEDEDIPSLEMLPRSLFTDSPMSGSPVTMEKCTVKFSPTTKQSPRSELKNSDEMDTGTTAIDPAANTTTDHKAYSMASSAETVTIGDNVMLSVEELFGKFTAARYNKNPAAEPDETIIIEDYDTNSVEESHETSSTANSVETPDKKSVDIKPFNFLGCPDDVRQRILRCILVSDKLIKPYWNFGALEVAAKVSGKENLNTLLVAFAGDKKLIDEATTILYGENTFKLQHAKVSLWWLKRIGSNISKIKHLIISVEEGVMDHFGTRFETLWYSIFLLLKAQHKLQSLRVNFSKWTHRVDNGLDPNKDNYVLEPRYGLIRTLLNFRGLDMAKITPGPYATKYITNLLEDALVLDHGQTNKEMIELEEDIQGPKRAKYIM